MMSIDAAIAAHRFGLGEADLSVVKPDPLAWLTSQIGPADAQRGDALASSVEATLARPELLKRAERQGSTLPDQKELLRRVEARASMHRENPNKIQSADAAARAASQEPLLDIAAQDIHARLLTAVGTQRPFAERLALFWSNHFTVSGQAAKTRGLVGAFEREAIRPHIAGSFQAMLKASTTHPAMLRYLDNQKSIGPGSLAAQRQARAKANAAAGLNENLAREVLELHTLGAESSRASGAGQPAYGQADVTSLAKVLTGWMANDQPTAESASIFEPRRHEPGTKQLLGKTYPEGPQALDMVLRDLALHPATARFLASKLARHFVSDEPPSALVDRLAQEYLKNEGSLPSLYRALLRSPEAWRPGLSKLKSPEEFAISAARLMHLDQKWLQAARDGGILLMGQAVQRAPSPAGWPDRAADWLGPEAVWKRIEWTDRLVRRWTSDVDARALARDSLGPLLSEETRKQIERAADGDQALSLLLLSPEFQRR